MKRSRRIHWNPAEVPPATAAPTGLFRRDGGHAHTHRKRICGQTGADWQSQIAIRCMDTPARGPKAPSEYVLTFYVESFLTEILKILSSNYCKS